jgi:ATP-dependent DNA ligase
MEARVTSTFPEPPGWAYEPKWDGFRAVVWTGPTPRLDSRNHRPLLRYFPELERPIVAFGRAAVLDTEIVIVRDEVTDFDALQQRIHPAESRVTKLSREAPARLVAFDLLAVEEEDLRRRPFSERRERLRELVPVKADPWHLTPSTEDLPEAKRWFADFEQAGCDGIVAKKLGGPYTEGKREMAKIKHRRTADVVVGGYRVHKDGDKIGSLLLGMYDQDGGFQFVGHCSGFSNEDRVSLLDRFRALQAEASFDSAARRPDVPSRWSGGRDASFVPVEPKVVIEVSYDQITGDRFRHATRFERWRPDKEPNECSIEQMVRPSGIRFSDVVEVGGRSS